MTHKLHTRVNELSLCLAPLDVVFLSLREKDSRERKTTLFLSLRERERVVSSLKERHVKSLSFSLREETNLSLSL